MTRPALLALTLLSLAPHAQAATCTMSATDLVFGRYSAGSNTGVDSTASVSLDCADDGSGTQVSYTIAIGAGSSGDPADRSMGGALHYNVYTDMNHTTVWGDGTGGTVEVPGTIAAPGTGTESHVVFGTIPAGQSPQPGSYADSLTVTITY